MNGWTDAALLQAEGIPTLLLGSTGGNYHTAGEWASISEIVSLAEILELTARGFLA
jgi:di/tripeptidase